MIVQGGVNKRISLTQFLKTLDSGDSIKFNPNQNAIDFSIGTKNKEFAFFVSGANDKIGINTNSPEEDFHVIGNIKTGSETQDGIYIGSDEVLTHPFGTPVSNVTISTTRETTGLEIYGNSSYVLNNGYNGQTKNIYLKSLDSGGAVATITVAQGLGFNRIELRVANGDGCTLKYLRNKWVCVGNNNARLYTV